MAQWIPVPLLVVTVALLIRAELSGRQKGIYVWKPLSTLLVILVAILGGLTPQAESSYTAWILAALVLSLGGDVALMFTSRRSFLVGLVLFLLAHVAYTIVFTAYNGLQAADLLTAVVLLGFGVWVYSRLRPGLGTMRIPVIIYMMVICVMVNRALSTLFGDVLNAGQAWLISLGAMGFWISDLMLGVNKFGKPFAWNRVSLAFYYGGQLLLAWSTGLF